MMLLHYAYFVLSLGPESTEPLTPDLPCFRLFDIYTKCTRKDVKEEIILYFTQCSSLRLVFATIAFCLGVNCPHIRQIYHWGAPDDVESYIQEVDRTGRDGLPSFAVLFYGKHTRRSSNELMLDYCQNSTICRCKLLFTGLSEKGLQLQKQC